jgi:hypothetical protein
MKTLRQDIIRLLRESELSARDLSGLLGIPEKEVVAHMAHVARSVNARGGRLEIIPSVCRQCGYTFKDRRRFSRPGRCPRCRATTISAPRFKIT